MMVKELLIISLFLLSFTMFGKERKKAVVDSTKVLNVTPRSVENRAFKKGEFLHFTVSYGVITAGYATISIDRTEYIKGRDCYVLKTTAKSRSAFDWIFKVRDQTESFLDIERFHSHKFTKRLREGSYKIDSELNFFQENGVARYRSKRYKKGKIKKKYRIIDIPYNTLDPLSALFYVRVMDLKVGETIFLPAVGTRKSYNIKVIVHKRETVKVGAGKFDCFVVEPVMADGGVFKKDGRVKVWLTADERKMPVKMSTKVYIGSIEAELDWYEEE
ncbi:MAG: hypothetical protein CR982_00350 [Candidatus Cloacimonadota bacterium]|nr:MAG: hypothetical protein CR982_00350 [Candidatus Cloacimonadota bacterium]PIE78751.1 MAG: hypothetical protein CSA15_06110 [Candidatus Delongbacteria bacterium]